jgi:hypothetical protein
MNTGKVLYTAEIKMVENDDSLLVMAIVNGQVMSRTFGIAEATAAGFAELVEKEMDVIKSWVELKSAEFALGMSTK